MVANLEIVNEAAEHINECHAEFIRLGHRNAKGIVEQINKAREIGEYLKAEQGRMKELRKNGVSIPPWKQHFAEKGETDFTFQFTYKTATNYIRVSDLLEEPITSLPDGVRVLTDIFRMSNELPEPEGHGQQTAHAPEYLGRAVKQITGFLSAFAKWRETEPLEKWSDEQKAEVANQLRPVVELYRKLEGDAKEAA